MFELKTKDCHLALRTIQKIAAALNIPSYYITNADKLPETTLQEKLEKARLLSCQSIRKACELINIDSKTYYNFRDNKKVSDVTIEKIKQYIQTYLKF